VTKQSAKTELPLEKSWVVQIGLPKEWPVVQIASPDKEHRDRNDRERKNSNRHCEDPERQSRLGDAAICKDLITFGTSMTVRIGDWWIQY
jgi:hypothetical protein